MTKSGAAPVDVGALNDQGRCSVSVVRQDIWPRTVGKARSGKVKAKKGRGGKEGKGKGSKIGMAEVRCWECRQQGQHVQGLHEEPTCSLTGRR